MIMPKIESKPDQNSHLSFWKKTLHVVVFLSLFILMFYCFSYVFKEKTHKYDTFYSSEKNSMDYLCAGISHTYYGINPVYVYTHSGYKGYNLGDEAQNIRFSYFWLREALKTQNPKVFFLDVGGLFYSESSMAEEWKLKEYSDMRFSMEKIQAADEGTDERNTRIGALFPLLYFHSNWKSLSEARFSGKDTSSFGARVVWGKNGSPDPLEVHPYDIQYEGDNKYRESSIISAENKAYFERILQLCKDNQVELVPYKTPTNNWDEERKSITENFVGKYGLDLLDMNEIVNINWETDTYDGGYHLNFWGNCKASECVCKFLRDHYGKIPISGDASNEWERLMEDYNLEYFESLFPPDVQRDYYFNWLIQNKDKLIIALAVRDNLSGDQNSIDHYLKSLGLSGYAEKNLNQSMIALIKNGEVVAETWSDDKLKYNKTLKPGDIVKTVQIGSTGKKSRLVTDAGLASVVLDGAEYALNQQGLNMVVMDQETGQVISRSVHFNSDSWLVNDESYEFDFWKDESIREGVPYSISGLAENNILAEEITFCPYIKGCFYITNAEGKNLALDYHSDSGDWTVEWSDYRSFPDELWVLIPKGEKEYQIRSLMNNTVLSTMEGEFVAGQPEGSCQSFRIQQKSKK